MDVREALEVVEELAPLPEWSGAAARNWPLAIISACGVADKSLDGDQLDRMTEAVSVLTGIPFTKMLTADEISEATPPLPPGLENQR